MKKLLVAIFGALLAGPASAVDPITAGFILANVTGLTISMTVAYAAAFVINYAISLS